MKNVIEYEELNEIKAMLDIFGYKYKEVRINGGILVYITDLMQIRKPTSKQKKQVFYPEVRISKHKGETGYYVRACGAIYKNQSPGQILRCIEQTISL